MSSGEAEFYGAVKGASTGLGMKALYRDIGYSLPLRLWTDSSAALGISSRQGLSKPVEVIKSGCNPTLAVPAVCMQQRVQNWWCIRKHAF